MRLGTEDRKKTIAAAGSIILALIFFVHRLSGPSVAPVSGRLAEPQPPPSSAAVHPRSERAASIIALSQNDPTLHLEWLRHSEGSEYTGNGRNIFLEEPEAPPPPPKPLPGPGDPRSWPTPVPASTPIPMPPIPLKFIGFANREGQPKRVFLSQNEDVFIGGVGEIINRRYKILRINVNSVEIQDVLTNNTQPLPLVQG